MNKAIFLDNPENWKPAYSPGMIATGELLFVSGQVAFDDQGQVVGPGDIKVQTEKVFDGLLAVLKAAGADYSNVVKINYYITDISLYPEVASVRAQRFSKPFPASTIVEVKGLLHPDLLIEIEAIATTTLNCD